MPDDGPERQVAADAKYKTTNDAQRVQPPLVAEVSPGHLPRLPREASPRLAVRLRSTPKASWLKGRKTRQRSRHRVRRRGASKLIVRSTPHLSAFPVVNGAGAHGEGPLAELAPSWVANN